MFSEQNILAWLKVIYPFKYALKAEETTVLTTSDIHLFNNLGSILAFLLTLGGEMYTSLSLTYT